MELLFATNNKHKIREISDLLDAEFRNMGLSDVNITEDIPEEEDTLAGTPEDRDESLCGGNGAGGRCPGR